MKLPLSSSPYLEGRLSCVRLAAPRARFYCLCNQLPTGVQQGWAASADILWPYAPLCGRAHSPHRVWEGGSLLLRWDG
jgi:hypothetical protein